MMKKITFLPNILLVATLLSLAACGDKNVKTDAPQTSQSSKDGGYYLDDGPGENAPADIDSIPNAVPKVEAYATRANKPYIALGTQYEPMSAYQPYKKVGTASWYGKRYHGKKTSIGEVYDMYGMTAAHPTLPIPSYAHVKNVTNGRSVLVRINDRGPFIDGRLIDLSYAAAYKLRMIEQGSAKVEVVAIDSLQYNAASTSTVERKPIVLPVETAAPVADVYEPAPVAVESETTYSASDAGFYLQVGAFKSEGNSNALSNKINNFKRPNTAEIFKMYNDGLYRVKVGPYETRKAADLAAVQLRKQYGIKAIVQDHF